jgi:eukaryotic-like serine/threonine-protein kinase
MNTTLPIDASRWARLKDHVADLASLDTGARVEALRSIAVDEADRDWLLRLAQPLIGDDPRMADSHPSAIGAGKMALLRWQSGDVIGRYRIESLLGCGGMGEVYAARSLGDDGMVALKVLRSGLDQHDYARFSDNEQRALRRLDDSRIAKFIEAFAADDIGTCLVLEWVDGKPLLSHCSSLGLDINQRLRLFVEVCLAVATAHQHLVVHRDLKPSNVLVTPDGLVKLLDFGVAKLLDDGGTHTQTHGNLFTLDYAAPEQILNEPVSTATDIYALGGLLFRLLADTSPYARTDGSSLIKAVLSEAPQRLADAIVRARREGGKPQADKLDRDLDRVVARAMDKDPRSRYRSALELAADVQAVLAGRPINSGGGSFYRLSKFVKRHRALAAAGVIAMLSLLATVIFGVHEARQTALHAHRADVANHFLLTALDLTDRFSSSNTGDVTLGEVLARAVTKARTELVDEPGVRANVLGQLGLALLHNGKTELARSALIEGYEARKTDSESTAFDRADSAQQLGSVDIERGTLDSAASYLHESLNWLVGAPPANPVHIATLTSLGKLASMRGNATEALNWYQEILQLRLSLPGDHRAEVAMDYNNLGTGLYNLARFAEADSAYAKGVELLQSQFGNTHPRLGYIQFGRCSALVQLGRFDEAAALLAESDRSLGLNDNSHGGSPGGVNSERMRATLDFYASDYASARRRLDTALPQLRASSPVSVAAALLLRGRVELRAGDPAAAVATLTESVKLYDDAGRQDHVQRWLASGLHGVALAAIGNIREGDAEVEASYARIVGDGTRQSVELGEMALYSGAAARRRGELAIALQRHDVAARFQQQSGWLGTLGRSLVMAERVLDGLQADVDSDARNFAVRNLEPTISALHDIVPNHPVLRELIAQRHAQ